MSRTDDWPARVDDTAFRHLAETEIRRAGPPAGTPPPYPPEEPDGPFGRGMLLALLVLALAAVAGLAGWLVTHRGNSHPATTATIAPAPTSSVAGVSTEHVAVPRIVGLTEQAALIQLGRAGLRLRIQSRTSGPHDGLVVEQRPVASEQAALGSSVLALVDRGPAPAKPAATPKAVRQTTTTTAQPPATAGPTTTTAATPAPSPAPPQAPVPDVTGQSEQAAVDALDKAGLLVSLVFVPSQDDLGTVEAQAKQPGTTVPAQSHVQINLSGGNGNFPPESVPNVIGKTLQDAVSALNGAQLRLIYEQLPVSSSASAGRIVQQTPLAGGKAPQHAQVLVYVGVQKEQ